MGKKIHISKDKEVGMKRLLIFVLVVAAISLGLTGCKKKSESKHSTKEHSSSDHPKSEHPSEHPK